MTASRARWLMVALSVAAASCGNDSSSTPHVTFVTDRPNISFLASGVLTGASTVFVQGFFFAPGMVIRWKDRPVPTQVVNSKLAQIQLDPAVDDPIAGSATVSAAIGDIRSDVLNVPIANGQLSFTGVEPAQIAPGSAATTISLIGTGFTPDTKVIWNDVQLEPTLVSGVVLQVPVPANFLAAAGEGIVQISAPSCRLAPDPCELAFTVSIGVSSKTTLRGTFGDIASDASHARLYLTTAGGIQALDPATATLGALTAVSPPPSGLAVSDQDQFLYTFAPFSSGVRLDLPASTGAQTMLPGEELLAVAGVPGMPGSFAFSTNGKVGIADGSTERPNVLTTGLATSLAFGADASTLYMLNTGLFVTHVDASGIISPRTALSATALRSRAISYDRTARLISGSAGEVFDEQGAVHPLSSFPAAHQNCEGSVLDGTVGKMFLACSEPAGLVVRSFDIATAQPIARIRLVPPDTFRSSPELATAIKMVRWGTNGLAVTHKEFISTSGSGTGVSLYSGPFVQ